MRADPWPYTQVAGDLHADDAADVVWAELNALTQMCRRFGQMPAWNGYLRVRVTGWHESGWFPWPRKQRQRSDQ